MAIEVTFLIKIMSSKITTGSDGLSSSTISSGLTKSKREIICNYVVYLHASFFKQDAATDDVFAEYFYYPLPEKLKALISVATGFARSLGANEQEIEDTVMVTSVFCTYQRSLGNDYQGQKAQADAPVYSLAGIKEASA